ncbi:fumarylacetoacetate hydrolase family protein [Pseudoalteromonas sp.]|uniref:fumarylacetoacetate hydrolase family protein n=1 Tax=Pseudoalteromonas sp. TaxID=53249 RepID=UPI0030028465
MDNSTHIQAIARHFIAQRDTAGAQSDLPTGLSLTCLEESLGVQQFMVALNNHQVFGWKCLLPLDDGSIILAPLLSKPHSFTQTCQLYTQNNKARVEPEIAFVLGQDLPARESYSDEQINTAVGNTYMALELIQNRFTDDYQPTHFEKLADGLFNQGIVIGPEINKADAFTAEQIELSITQNAHSNTQVGKHPCGLAQAPLYWAVNYLTQLGVDIKAGQVFITGSYCGVLDLDTDTNTAISYTGLGEYSITFSAR